MIIGNFLQRNNWGPFYPVLAFLYDVIVYDTIGFFDHFFV